MLDTSRRTIATLTAAACLGGGGWAIAADSSGDAATSTPGTTATVPAASGTAPVPGSRPVHTPANAEALAKITAAVEAKLPGATVDRASETADGYKVHVTASDGTRKRVMLSSEFAVTEVADAPAGGRGGPCPDGASSGASGETPPAEAAPPATDAEGSN